MGESSIAARAGQMRLGAASVATWPARRWLVAVVGAVGVALMTGIPTGIVHTGFYTRMTPTTWWDYPVWALSAMLAGLIAATYVRVGGTVFAGADRSRRSIGATVTSGFAVGCPVCNKVVVALIGSDGALSYWAPFQPVLGLISLGLLAAGLMARLRGGVTCSIRTSS